MNYYYYLYQKIKNHVEETILRMNKLKRTSIYVIFGQVRKVVIHVVNANNTFFIIIYIYVIYICFIVTRHPILIP